MILVSAIGDVCKTHTVKSQKKDCRMTYLKRFGLPVLFMVIGIVLVRKVAAVAKLADKVGITQSA